MQIKMVNQLPNPRPAYSTAHITGRDFLANHARKSELEPTREMPGHAGIFNALPESLETLIEPRIGLTEKHALSFVNNPATDGRDCSEKIRNISCQQSGNSFIASIWIGMHK